MDSQAPNSAAAQWLLEGGFEKATGMKPEQIRREVTYGQSRFDLAFSIEGKPCFMEVKGVTLENDGTAMFPDAPTERGVKHLEELAKAVKEGFQAYVLFVIQMKGIRGFSPNEETHPAFGEALRRAVRGGVHVLAFDCAVTADSMRIDEEVPAWL